jgi:hypothetical protein
MAKQSVTHMQARQGGNYHPTHPFSMATHLFWRASQRPLPSSAPQAAHKVPQLFQVLQLFAQII